jgi:hypothetical protein
MAMPDTPDPAQQAPTEAKPDAASPPAPKTLFHFFTDRIGLFASVAAIIWAILAAFALPLFRTIKIDDDVARQRRVSEEMLVQAERSRAEAAQLRDRMEALAKENTELLKKGPLRYATLSPTDQQILQEAKANGDQLRTRLGSLEAAILSTPEKAVALPMLKQQMDMLQDRNRTDIDGLRGEMGRLFTLVQWCIGLMFTIGLAVLGISITNMRKEKAGLTPKA